MQVGDVAVGTVQSVQLYGAFLEFEDSTSGLLHVSQISHDRVANVADVLSVGDKIKVLHLLSLFLLQKRRLPINAMQASNGIA